MCVWGGGGARHETPSKEVPQNLASPGTTPFLPGWNLYKQSRLSVRSNEFDFSRHALPPVVVVDMKAMANSALSHNMTYFVA